MPNRSRLVFVLDCTSVYFSQLFVEELDYKAHGISDGTRKSPLTIPEIPHLVLDSTSQPS